MTATNHVITGMVIGSVLSPALALPAALLSHFILDSLPHFDTGDKDHTTKTFLYVLVCDMAVAASLLLSVFLLRLENWPVLMVAGVLAASPDLMWLPRWINEIRGKKNNPLGPIASFHSRIQKLARPNNWYWELIWLTAMIFAFVQLAF